MSRESRKRTEAEGQLTRRDLLHRGAQLGAGLAGATALTGVRPIIALAQANGPAAPRWAMIIDTRRCIGCRACTVACKAEFGVALGVWRSCVVQKDQNGSRAFLPLLCNHCREPELDCVRVCPGDERTDVYTAPSGRKTEYTHRASFRRPDGVIAVDPELCIGCGLCLRACPYGARFFDPSQKPGSDRAIGDYAASKCDYCRHRIDQGIEPSCVNTCQGRARIFGDINDPNSAVSKLLREHDAGRLLEQKNTDPQTYYIDLPAGVYSVYLKGENFRDGI